MAGSPLSLGTVPARNCRPGCLGKTLVRLADPVLSNLANETLKKRMPYQSLAPDRQRFSYLEAVGRTVCGMAPWLELGADDTPEGQLRKKYIELTVKGISNAVNPSSPDYLIFGEPSQPLVDAAFLAEGLLRAPKQLWGNLSASARKRVVTELKRSRAIKPNESNWVAVCLYHRGCIARIHR